MKHIKIVTYDNFPFGGAPANFVRNFALSVSQQDNVRVEVVLPKGNYGNSNRATTFKKGVIEKLTYRHLGYSMHPVHAVGKLIDNLLSLVLPVFYLIREGIKKRSDVIIIYNTSFTTTLVFLFIRFIINTQLIIILPEFYEKPPKRFSFARIHWINFYVAIRYLVKYADKFIVLSDFMRTYLLSQHIQDENIFILPNITDPQLFEREEVSDFISGKLTIGYSGTPTRKDGIDDLLNSFAIIAEKYPQTHLLIIGDVVNGKSIIPALQNKVTKAGISERVTFTGLVSFNQVPDLLNSCQILALTRPNGVFAQAGFPTKLGEYFACKKPVLATSVGDIPLYFNNEDQLILTTPEDIADIVNGFEKLICDSALCQKIAANGYKWMEINLNYRNLSNKILEFIGIC